MITSINAGLNSYKMPVFKENKTNHVKPENKSVTFGMTLNYWILDVAAIFTACEILGEGMKAYIKSSKLKKYAKAYLPENHKEAIQDIHSLSSHVVNKLEALRTSTKDNSLKKKTEKLEKSLRKAFGIESNPAKINGYSKKQLPESLSELREKVSKLFFVDIQDADKQGICNTFGSPILKRIDNLLNSPIIKNHNQSLPVEINKVKPQINPKVDTRI